MAWVGLVGFSSHAFESALAASPYPSLLAGVSAVDAIIGTAKYGNRLEDIWRKNGLKRREEKNHREAFVRPAV